MIAVLAITAALAIAAAAGTAGLWWGERGRRIAAEHMLAHGTPDRPRAQVFQGREDSDVQDAREIRRIEVEGILATLEEEQLLRGTKHSMEDLRREAERLYASIHT